MPLLVLLAKAVRATIPCILALATTVFAAGDATSPTILASSSTNAAGPVAATADSKSIVPLLKEISPGIFDYKGLRLDKANHRITFDGTVNQRAGAIEYLLVNERGKVHESILATKVIPHDIHLALLLIGLKEQNISNPHATVPPSAIDSNYLQNEPKLTGDPVLISVSWTKDGKQNAVAVDRWIFNSQTKELMTPGPWIYNGSLVEEGIFLADQELSIVALVTDPTALVNNTRKGYDNDEIWQVQESAIPPLNTPVKITISLAESDPKP